eukprot:1954627-Rhodomonas_salina.1
MPYSCARNRNVTCPSYPNPIPPRKKKRPSESINAVSLCHGHQTECLSESSERVIAASDSERARESLSKREGRHRDSG